MKEFLAVFIGGGIGSMARYGISKSLSGFSFTFPWATLFANLLSCLVAGIIVSFIDQKIITHTTTKVFLLVGFCGGFSTFSTLIRESLLMMEEKRAGPMLFYNLLSLILGLLCMLSGIWLGKLVMR
jgi:fluoride exporter